MVGLCRLLSDIQSQAKVVPSSLALRTLARTMLGSGGGEVACCHKRHVLLQCSGGSAGCQARRCGLLVPHPTALRTRSEMEVEVRHLPAPPHFPL